MSGSGDLSQMRSDPGPAYGDRRGPQHRTPTRRGKKNEETLMRFAIATGSSEGHLALGYLYYYATAITSAPWPNRNRQGADCQNESEAYLPSAHPADVSASGGIKRPIWKKRHARSEKQGRLINLCFSYMARRDFETASKILDRVIAAIAAIVFCRIY